MSLPGDLIPMMKSNMYCQYKQHSVPALATYRLCTESDSFGSEYVYCCEDCAAVVREKRKKKESEVGQCDYCKANGVAIRPFRDLEEGNSGRVYRVCDPCRKSAIDAFCDDNY